MSNKPEPAFFDLPSAITYSGLGRSSIYAKLKTGDLEGRKFGKRLLISKESLDGMLAALPKFGKVA